jgi:inosose dehydratase
LAVNPIAYWMASGTPDRSTATLGAAFTALADIGYRAVKADVPSDMAPEHYLDWLDGFGLSPALSLFPGTFDDPSTHVQVAEQARRFAAVQASLGLSVCMISTTEPSGSARMEHPAIGSDFDPSRLSAVIDGVAASSEAMRSEGVKAALHPHVGGWIETEAEVRAALDQLDADLLAFGPDTGHMSWAGMDVFAVLSDYADRIVGVHLKDTFAAGIAAGKAGDLDYRTATAPGRIWAEPGTGQADLQRCVATFPPSYSGDFMIEIDVPSMPNLKSHQVAYDWAVAHLPLTR